MKIIVDGFGGDNAPLAVLQGCEMAVKEYGVEIVVTGDEETLKKTAQENGVSLEHISFHHAPSVITMEDEPTSILKEKADCSMAAISSAGQAAKAASSSALEISRGSALSNRREYSLTAAKPFSLTSFRMSATARSTSAPTWPLWPAWQQFCSSPPFRRHG